MRFCFIHLVLAVFSSGCCELDEEAVISLWYRSLPSLEEAVLSLLESVLAATKPTPLTFQRQIDQSLLVGHKRLVKKYFQCCHSGLVFEDFR